MPAPATERREVCFGRYQVDVQEGELRTAQGKIKVQEKPFQILAILLERPGKLVTRDELHQAELAALWLRAREAQPLSRIDPLC